MSGVEVSDRSSGSELRRKQDASRQEPLEISVIGNVAVAFKGQGIRIKSRKSLAVLAYIALNESRQETRERLVGLFWSETDEEKARASLRQTLRELRRHFAEAGYSGLQTEKLAIELDPGSFRVDLWDVVNEAEQWRVHPLLLKMERLSDRLLENLDDIDPSFRSWVLAKRQTFHDRLLRALEDGLRDGAVDARTRRQIAEALISLDPTHEEACRSLMRSRAEEGDVAASLRVYKTLWDLLDDEYDMEPSAKTQQLVAEIKQGEIELAPAAAEYAPARLAMPKAVEQLLPAHQPKSNSSSPSANPATKVTLFVRPFGMNGVDAERLHLVQGFRHHLVACLVRFREWNVSDSTGQSPDGGPTSLVSAEYGVEATAYQTKGLVSLVVTLMELKANLYVWSERFDLGLETWFEAQQQIVRRIAISLNVQLSTERLVRLASEPDVSLAIYDRWLRGRALMTGYSHEDWNRAGEIFSETIREAPNFSPAYSSLAGWNNAVHIVHPGIFRNPERTRTSVELARKSVELDPLDSRAQLNLGWSYAMAKRYGQAEVHVELAHELNENDPWLLLSASLFYSFRANFERANEFANHTLEMTRAPSPTYWGYLVSIYFLLGDYPAAFEAANRANDVIKTLPGWKAAALFYMGDKDEAKREGQRFLANVRSNWFGPARPTDDTIARWLLHLYPISHAEHWKRLRDGLIGAGIPVSGIEHHAW